MVDLDRIGSDIFLVNHVYVWLVLLFLFAMAVMADFLKCEFPDLLLKFACKVGRVFHRLDALTLFIYVPQRFYYVARLLLKLALLK